MKRYLAGVCGWWLVLVPALAQDPPLHGFVDVRGGLRTANDPYQRDTSLSEMRLQLDWNHLGDWAEVIVRTDLLYDDVADEPGDVDLEEGRGWLDPREVQLLFSPLAALDVRFGRQILTWGTGDLLFINDLFPKDWQSFFSGRDEEYLKAPSDALMASWFPRFGAVDLVYVPRFDADRHLTGARISFWNPGLGRRSGRDAVLMPERPQTWFEDAEWALRISGNRDGTEWAFYGYDGFWKSPNGFDEQTGKPTFPPLRVWGASLRMPLRSGLFHLETGYYDSRSDAAGDNPAIGNSEWRLLSGYERELARDFSATVQVYLEVLGDYRAYRNNLPPGISARDEHRYVTTLRLTRLALKQTLSCSLFAYYSPSDQDGYVRPLLKYKLTDAWLLTAGANLFWGDQEHTFFGQLEKNSNVYAGARYSF